MSKFISEVKEAWSFFILEPEPTYIHLSVWKRIIAFPFMIPYWVFLIFAFSFCMGSVGIMMGVMMIIGAFFNPDNKDELSFGLTIIIAPFLAPIVWWIRYILHREFNAMIRGFDE